jgi:hypothetical protein
VAWACLWRGHVCGVAVPLFSFRLFRVACEELFTMVCGSEVCEVCEGADIRSWQISALSEEQLRNLQQLEAEAKKLGGGPP